MALLRDLIQILLELVHNLFSNGAGRTTTLLGGGAWRDAVPVYKRNFKEAFLGESQDFYRMESTSQLSRAQATMGPGLSPLIPGGFGLGVNNVDKGKPTARSLAMEYVRLAQGRLEEEKCPIHNED